MTSTDIKQQQNLIKEDLIKSLSFEIQEMQKILNLMQSEKWSEVDLQLTLKNPQEWKTIINKFNFGSCIPQKYIIAIKKLCKLAFEEGINIKQNKLNQIKNTLNY